MGKIKQVLQNEPQSNQNECSCCLSYRYLLAKAARTDEVSLACWKIIP